MTYEKLFETAGSRFEAVEEAMQMLAPADLGRKEYNSIVRAYGHLSGRGDPPGGSPAGHTEGEGLPAGSCSYSRSRKTRPALTLSSHSVIFYSEVIALCII